MPSREKKQHGVITKGLESLTFLAGDHTQSNKNGKDIRAKRERPILT